MGIVARYVLWVGHDAGGHLPPVDVLAGVLAAGTWRVPPGWPPLEPDEALVVVPPQWIGDWEHGTSLAPGYQHVWRAARAALRDPPTESRPRSYRPRELPASATGPRGGTLARRRTMGRSSRE